ncbi:MAG: prepilin peptidase [Deltaproteobacteria bacterium]|nr:prepilin peptidase [Deltaproteobacteria bacterium]
MTVERALADLLAGGGGYALSFILGALFGSFANVCIYRLPPTDDHPSGRSVVSPGSHCSSCQTPIRWYDNLPVLSYLWLRGRCRGCGTQFSARYMVVELVTAALFALAFHFAVHGSWTHGELWSQLHFFGILAAFSFLMVVITFIDLDHKLILNKLTYPAIAFFYLAGVSLPGHDWQRGLWGIAVGYGLIRLVSDGYYYATGREGLGYGDGKLLAVVGALYGWRAVLFALFVGSMVGSVISITVLSWRRARARSSGEEGQDEPSIRHVEVPFGPFLVVGALVYAFTAPYLQHNFGHLLGVSLL